MLFKILSALLCVLVPGSSFLLSKRTLTAFSIPLIALAWVLLMSYTRWIVTAKGFAIFLIGMIAIYFFSYIAGLVFAKSNAKKSLSKKYFSVLFILLALLNLGITVSSHKYKADWYGFAFYHIPSSSMEPTLYPGDVVFVDTWTYKKQRPNTRDIVVSRKGINSLVLAKRITNLRFNEESTEVYLEGDNTTKSTDSRSFGWVKSEYLIGEVKFIWFSFRDKKRFLDIIKD